MAKSRECIHVSRVFFGDRWWRRVQPQWVRGIRPATTYYPIEGP